MQVAWMVKSWWKTNQGFIKIQKPTICMHYCIKADGLSLNCWPGLLKCRIFTFLVFKVGSVKGDATKIEFNIGWDMDFLIGHNLFLHNRRKLAKSPKIECNSIHYQPREMGGQDSRYLYNLGVFVFVIQVEEKEEGRLEKNMDGECRSTSLTYFVSYQNNKEYIMRITSIP